MTITSKEILYNINSPDDLRKLDKSKLTQLCEELRRETIEIVSQTGGHLGAGLGVVELTVALHYVFKTPEDKLVWDIGHQAYPHKILTGRRSKMLSLRQKGGISGFTRREESKYDCFIGGHGGTAISSALGMAKARDFNNQKHEVITVIGDGSMSAGMAYEAMNNAGSKQGSRIIVILNDNKMSIAPAVGSLTTYLAKLISSKPYLSFRTKSKQFLNLLPASIKTLFKKFERNTKDLINNGNFFEEMGFYYIGPINGHNIDELVTLLENIKRDTSITKPILLHVITEKGKGFSSVNDCEEKFHAVTKFDLVTGKQNANTKSVATYTEIFASSLIDLATNDKKIVAITAAMPSGTGLNKFAEKFPTRMFDVGMAEQHAVTFAAGLACEQIKPFVALYSTFLQRAYDQVINDVAIQKLPVRFIIDRAGYVGADGPTHSGSFDLTYLLTLPNFIIMCPSSGDELSLMLGFAASINNTPCAIRFPRGQAALDKKKPEPINLGKGVMIQNGENIAIISLGTRLEAAKEAARLFKEKYMVDISIFDARFAKPLDSEAIIEIAKKHKTIITLEEGSAGGFSFYVNQLLLNLEIKIVNLFYPDVFLEQALQEEMHKEANLSADKILQILEKHR